MIDPLREGLDMPVKHRARAATAHLMPRAVNIEPFRGRFFSATNLVPHFRVKNFCAATGHGAQACFTQKLERIPDRQMKNSLGEMADLDRSKGFDV